MKAAHPQRSTAAVDPPEQPVDQPAAGEDLAARNAPPTSMSVMDINGLPLSVDLAWSEGVLFAPGLSDLAVSPDVRQYITQFCAMWSGSVPATGKVRAQYPPQPRRGQLVFRASQLHAMLGLADDESLVQTVVDSMQNQVRFVVDSPRLAECLWDSEPPTVGLPLSAWYEGRRGDGDPGGVDAAQRQLDALRARSATAQREWEAAVAQAERRVAAFTQAADAGSGALS